MSYQFLLNYGSDDKKAIAYLREKRVLRSRPTCNVQGCPRLMTEICYEGYYTWRCPEHKGHKVSVRKGSYWEGSKLPMSKHIQVYLLKPDHSLVLLSSFLTVLLCIDSWHITFETAVYKVRFWLPNDSLRSYVRGLVRFDQRRPRRCHHLST